MIEVSEAKTMYDVTISQPTGVWYMIAWNNLDKNTLRSMRRVVLDVNLDQGYQPGNKYVSHTCLTLELAKQQLYHGII